MDGMKFNERGPQVFEAAAEIRRALSLEGFNDEVFESLVSKIAAQMRTISIRRSVRAHARRPDHARKISGQKRSDARRSSASRLIAYRCQQRSGPGFCCVLLLFSRTEIRCWFLGESPREGFSITLKRNH